MWECLLLILERVGGMVTVPSLATVDGKVSLDNFPFASPHWSVRLATGWSHCVTMHCVTMHCVYGANHVIIWRIG